MNKKILCKITYLITVLVLFLIPEQADAQFYNGHQMTFGKNRVQYNDYDWQYLRFDNFDIYYSQNGKELAKYTSEYVTEIMPEIENFFGYVLQERIIFLVYNRLSDFRQSNIGLETGNVQFNVGGVTQISDNKVFLFYETDHEKFKVQIKKAIAQVILTEMLYGDDFKEKVTNSTLISLPEWYEKGLISYVSTEWNFELENKVKDGITSGKFKKVNHLTGDDAEIAGHSIWYYIAEEYGKDVISNIIYLTRVNKNADSGLMYVLGASIKHITPSWIDFFNIRFNQTANYQTDMGDSIVVKPKKSTVYQQLKIHPNGEMYAYTTNVYGKYRIYIYNAANNEILKILQLGHKIEQINDYTYPILEWHPTGKILSYVIENEGDIFLYQYFIETEELRERKMIDFTKILSFSYSDDGKRIVLSAVKDGYTDIFELNVAGGVSTRITYDLADDLNPKFIENSKKIIFASNRISDTLQIEKFENHGIVANNYDIFIYDSENADNVLTRITSTIYTSETSPNEISKNAYTYLSDENGITNLYTATFDSTISYIDTTTHYRYYSICYPLTNYYQSILEYDINKKQKQLAQIILDDNKYYMYKKQFAIQKNTEVTSKISETEFRKDYTEELIDEIEEKELELLKLEIEQNRQDSIAALPLENYVNPDSLIIDINNYVFEIEKETPYKYFYEKNYSTTSDADTFSFPKAQVYLTSFYKNYVVNQVDFGVLSESYQKYVSAQPYYFNPGVNLFFKLGVNDLFEDYKIVGGFRMGLITDSYEFLLSLEDLKTRLDKQYLFHRQTIVNETNVLSTKIISNELIYLLRYPLSQVSAFKTTLSLRYDKDLTLSTEYNTMIMKPSFTVFASAKAEYIFDNTFDLGLNLYDGIRSKVFAEFYQQVEGNYDFITILGCDFRYYEKIHRNLIFATRFAASTSFGTGKLLYYLGGVDNWTTLSFDPQNRFDFMVNVNEEQNYIYQAVATNLRGFRQNTRNGSTFALINSEIRWPIIKYLANRPLNSDFFNNFQVVGFFDVGSAWSGLSPLDPKNTYNKVTIENGPVTVIIDVDRAPVIAGYGFGIRSRLFGYFFRMDWAWGLEGRHIMPRMFYLSLNLDF
jgi:Tol biopolymer transport system component